MTRFPQRKANPAAGLAAEVRRRIEESKPATSFEQVVALAWGMFNCVWVEVVAADGRIIWRGDR